MLNFKDRNLVLSSKSLNDFKVVCLSAIFGQEHVLGFDLVVFAFEGFGDLVDSLGKERVSVGSLNYALEGGLEIDVLDFCGHLATT